MRTDISDTRMARHLRDIKKILQFSVSHNYLVHFPVVYGMLSVEYLIVNKCYRKQSSNYSKKHTLASLSNMLLC